MIYKFRATIDADRTDVDYICKVLRAHYRGLQNAPDSPLNGVELRRTIRLLARISDAEFTSVPVSKWYTELLKEGQDNE